MPNYDISTDTPQAAPSNARVPIYVPGTGWECATPDLLRQSLSWLPLKLDTPALLGSPYNLQSKTGSDNDLYTVPAGKRAIILSHKMYSPANPTQTANLQYKSGGSGSYLQLGAAVAVSTSGLGVTSNFTFPGFVFEAGDVISAHHSDGSSAVNHQLAILTFDNTSGLKTLVNTGLSNGNNTLYSGPASGKKAIFPQFGTATASSPLSPFGGLSAAFVWNNSGSARAYNLYHVPTGGSAGNATMMDSLSAQASGARASLTPMGIVDNGDSIILSTDAAANQWAWLTVFEF